MSTRVTAIEVDGVVAIVDYIPTDGGGSYVAQIGILPQNRLASKSFGNGTAAEDWLLEELSLPKSLLILKHSA